MKDAYIAAHERLISEYMEAHPGVDWTDAYQATADRAYEAMIDDITDRADQLKEKE